MLESLYEEAINKKGTIQEQIVEYQHKDLDLSKNWIEKTIPLPLKDKVIAAGDGSLNKKRFISFYLYAVAAESLIYNPNKDQKLKKYELTNIDTLSHQKFLDERLSNFMNIFELKNAIKTIEDNKDLDYYLLDGSIYGNIIPLFPSPHDIPKKTRIDIIKQVNSQFKESIKNKEENIKSNDLINTLDLDNKFKDYEISIFLENIEKSLLYIELLKHKEKIVAISKTSSSKDFFNSNVPDIALLNYYSTNEGYSTLRYRNASEDIRTNFLIGDEFFKNIDFTIFYARLSPNTNVLKFELPYHASEEECLQVLSDLKKDSVGGYPYLLYKAHHDVVIQNNDMNSISSIVNIIERQGREML
ncbi:MAG: DNA double-strand break repair nuclease NurA [Methanobacteriaceae archaeon]|jgi:NurA-like 5'-3' nuclease|uniref:DNA double-strand break repair nuclease NurA n=1 Tax=unclassified Methanobrevibacter TaxID=2638681 RepID=UPI0037589CAE|nr:DNA double-strand break repair nuclease NurA [Methanobacteriaceae archaeon]